MTIEKLATAFVFKREPFVSARQRAINLLSENCDVMAQGHFIEAMGASERYGPLFEFELEEIFKLIKNKPKRASVAWRNVVLVPMGALDQVRVECLEAQFNMPLDIGGRQWIVLVDGACELTNPLSDELCAGALVRYREYLLSRRKGD